MERIEVIIDENCKDIGVEGAVFCVLSNLTVGASSPAVRDEIQRLNTCVAENLDAIIAAPETEGYGEILTRMGFPGATHAGRKLTQLVAKRGLNSISNVVDAYNIVAAKSAIPVGAHDVDSIKFPLHLELARENLKIRSFGNNKEKTVLPGSLVYIDSNRTPIANISKNDVDSADHAVTERTTTVLLTLIEHENLKGVEARNVLNRIAGMLKIDNPGLDCNFIEATWSAIA